MRIEAIKWFRDVSIAAVPGVMATLCRHIRLFGFLSTVKEVYRNRQYIFAGAIAAPADIRLPAESAVRALSGSVDLTVSVIIPVKNPDDDLAFLLAALNEQTGFKAIEIVIVDSSDSEFCRDSLRGSAVRYVRIPPESFSHSHARNLGAEKASGELLLFTVQDALPPTAGWLRELYASMAMNDVAAVSCAEIPRENADLFYLVMSWNHNKFMGIDKGDRILSWPLSENHLALRKNAQISDLACLIWREVFMTYKFRCNYAEDLDLGMRLIRDGYRLALLGSSRIIHSHNRDPYYHLRRGYVDTRFMSQIIPNHDSFVVDADRVIPDMLDAYAIVNALAADTLSTLALPCPVSRLSKSVLSYLRAAGRAAPSTLMASDAMRDATADSFRDFMAELQRRSGVSKPRARSGNNVCLIAIEQFLMLVFNYMDKTYDQISVVQLDEFRDCLHKVAAFNFGVCLASANSHATASAREQFAAIHNALSSGV